MNTKKIFLSFVMLIVLINTNYGQKAVAIPGKFVATIPPGVGSDEWYQLNHSKNEFGVSIINGSLTIQKIKKINKCELEISGGTLIGLDRGEWGGELIFRSADTTKKDVDIKAGNIKFIFNFKEKIYFIEGLAHISYSGGAMFELDRTDKGFTFTKVVDFDDAPEAFTICKDKIYIASHQNFYIIHDFKKELIFKDTFWNGLYPNSIAVFDDKDVFLGIRAGFVKLNLVSKKMLFYKVIQSHY